ncbi:DUF3618 domain-containing protein [Streptomyces sp. NPDC052043]|uniref:DUF3618 domain-containing protein n=1 Tax=Streptomyces sp. NPDC052043 TaxID=3365684 RepID=UPI0037D08B6F
MTDRTQGGGGFTPPAGAKGPDELRYQIEQTRSQLGDTVQELAAKADVKGRARARAADLKDKAGAMTVQLRSSATQAGHAVQERATRTGHQAQERASRAGQTLQERAPVSNAVQVYRRNPRPLVLSLVAGSALVAAGLLIRRGRQARQARQARRWWQSEC